MGSGDLQFGGAPVEHHPHSAVVWEMGFSEHGLTVLYPSLGPRDP